jgi:hypothetical protein
MRPQRSSVDNLYPLEHFLFLLSIPMDRLHLRITAISPWVVILPLRSVVLHTGIVPLLKFGLLTVAEEI